MPTRQQLKSAQRARKFTNRGLKLMEHMLNSPFVHAQTKTLLKGISDRAKSRNLSQSDCEIFEQICKDNMPYVCPDCKMPLDNNDAYGHDCEAEL
jgi:hypothetical protein